MPLEDILDIFARLMLIYLSLTLEDTLDVSYPHLGPSRPQATCVQVVAQAKDILCSANEDYQKDRAKGCRCIFVCELQLWKISVV